MHVTFLFGLIVPASYDEYTVLVNGDGASKHVWKAVEGAYCWWKPGYRDPIELCDFSSGCVSGLLLFFLRHA